jgi:hypothetical protein
MRRESTARAARSERIRMRTRSRTEVARGEEWDVEMVSRLHDLVESFRFPFDCHLNQTTHDTFSSRICSLVQRAGQLAWRGSVASCCDFPRNIDE